MPDENEPISLETFGDLLRYGYKLCAYCRECGVHRDIDLSKLPPDRPQMGTRFRCRDCGSVGAMTLSQINPASGKTLPALDSWRSRFR